MTEDAWPAVPPADLSAGAPVAESSAAIRARVEAARLIQRDRFRGRPGVHANAHMTSRDVKVFCRVGDAAERLLRQAIAKLGLSARAHSRVLKLARTIADLTGERDIGVDHVSEAIQYRSLDRARLGAGAVPG